jgi:hypothetical protein
VLYASLSNGKFYVDVHITSSLTVSQGAQEIFKLLPHIFIEAEKLPEISDICSLSSSSMISFVKFSDS